MSAVCRRCQGTGREPDWRVLGRRIAGARKRRGWSLRALGTRARVTAQYICDMEHGRRPIQGPGAQRVLSVLGVRAATGRGPA